MKDHSYILKWLDTPQIMEIANECSITTRHQAINVIKGRSENQTLLGKLIKRALDNYELSERSKILAS